MAAGKHESCQQNTSNEEVSRGACGICFGLLAVLCITLSIASVAPQAHTKWNSNVSTFRSELHAHGATPIVRHIDTIGYRQTKFMFRCDWNRYNVLVGGHHKTGSELFCYRIYLDICIYFLSHCRDNKKHGSSSGINNHLKRKHIDKFVRTHQAQIKPNSDKRAHIVIANIIRNPVDLVLSGYNYHQRAPQEEWTVMNISHAAHDKNALHDLCEDMLRYLSAQQIPQSLSISQIYKTSNVSYGLHLEFMRYLFCVWQQELRDAYLAVQKLKRKHLDNYMVHIETFRLEDFKRDFNGTVNQIFDLHGILHHKDRVKLMKKLRRHNAYGNAAHLSKRDAKHITAGSYDRELQLDVLLRDQKRCQMLKNQTLMLRYQWMYDTYC